jgi:hypothetical protein
MNRFLSFSLAALAFLCLLIGSERKAWGYVDPGSGLIALQTFFSVAAAYIYIVRNRIRAFFTRRKPVQRAVMPVSVKAVDTREAA